MKGRKKQFELARALALLLLNILGLFLILVYFSGHAFSQDAGENESRLLPPQITIYPQTFIAGEQTLYLEGTSPPNSDITIYLKKGGETIKKWLSKSNEQGMWTFSSSELLESGKYELMARVEKNEKVSDLSEKRELAVKLSGVAIGSFLIGFKTFALVLGFLLLFLIAYASFFIARGNLLKKKIRKEAWEARQMFEYAFEKLGHDIEKRIELFDAQPGFNEEEKKVCEDLKNYLLTAKISIEKEIGDVEKLL